MAIIDVSREHPLLQKYCKLWQFYMDSYKGGHHYIKPWRTVSEVSLDAEAINSYLYPHEFERRIPYKFQNRHRRSFYPNYCRMPINTFTKYIFSGRSEISRKYEETENGNYLPYITDIDKRGTDVDNFMKRATTIMLITGLAYILVDKAPVPEGIITAEQQIDAGIRAYANILTPELVQDWSEDAFGNYYWVLIKSNSFDDSDFTEPRGSNCLYYLWTRDEIFVLDEMGELVDSDMFPINPLPNGIGEIPLIKMTYTDIDVDGEPESMLADIAKINREIYNAYSLYQEELYKFAFSQLMIPKSADDFSEQSQQDLIAKISTDIVMQFPEGSQPPAYLTPPVQALVEKRAYINELILKIMQMSNLEKQDGVDGSRHLSGIAMAFSFNDTWYTVSQMAQKIEDFERKMWRYIQAYDEELLVDDISIEYPTDFDVRADQFTLDYYDKIKANVEMSPTAQVIADMDILKMMFKNQDQAPLKVIEDELLKIYQKRYEETLSGNEFAAAEII